MEESSVLDLTLFELGLDSLRSLNEVGLVHSGERKHTAWIDAHTLDGELLGREVTTLNQEELVDVVRDAREELDLDLELLLGQDFAGHVAALDYTLSRQGAQVNVELERNLANILNEEVTRLILVVCNFSEVKLVGAQTEGDIVGLSLDGDIVVGTAIDTHHSHAAVSEAITSVEGEFNVLRLIWLEDAAYGENVEDLVDRQMLLLLFLFLLVSIVSIDLFLLINIWCILKEAPFVGDGHS